MDPRLLEFYNRELQYIREMGGEFATAFPKIAGRLGLDAFECSDPYVERLLEGFAFLTARIHLKMDAEYPHFTQHLLETTYPHYLAPTPSMVVVQMQPDLAEGNLAEGVTIPRHTILRSQLGPEDQTACQYRTAHDVTLWPLQLTKADYVSREVATVQIPRHLRSEAKAMLSVRLQTTAGLNFDELSLDRLTLFVRGREEMPLRLYEQIFAHAIAVVVHPPGREPPWQNVLSSDTILPVGFEDHQAMLPFDSRSFHGYRLLHEYFAFHRRFMFAELTGLRSSLKRCQGNEIELLILFDQVDRSLEDIVDHENLVPFCSPAINLFSQPADTIHLNAKEHEYHLVPDRTRPLDLEVYSVTRAVGRGASDASDQEFRPLYASADFTGSQDEQAYFALRRQPRVISSRQQLTGPRSSYSGSEVFLSLVDGREAPYRPDLNLLLVDTLCTNRDLPLFMPVGKSYTDFTLDTGQPVDWIRCVAGPSEPKPSFAFESGDLIWRLINHLSLNYRSLVDSGDGGGARALRELLMLYSHRSDRSVQKQIDGVRSVSTRQIVRRLPGPGPLSMGRGLEVTLMVDEAGFQGIGAYLLGAVLERFFAKYVSINSFTETVLRSESRQEIKRWPMRIGRRQVL